MLTYSIVWVALAATVIMFAMSRRSAARQQCEIESAQPAQNGKGLAVLAVVYGVLLMAGFLYVSWQHGIELFLK